MAKPSAWKDRFGQSYLIDFKVVAATLVVQPCPDESSADCLRALTTPQRPGEEGSPYA